MKRQATKQRQGTCARVLPNGARCGKPTQRTYYDSTRKFLPFCAECTEAFATRKATA